jgi:uncharacterized protein (UPF0333 family)
MKAQVSFEMLVLVGALLMFALPVIFFFFSSAHSDLIKTNAVDADALATRLSYEINRVMLSGNDTKVNVVLYVPTGVKKISANNSILSVYFEMNGHSFVFKKQILAKNNFIIKGITSGPHPFRILYIDCETVGVSYE